MVPEQPDRAHAPRGQITHRQHFNSPTLDASFWRSANYGTDGRAATMLQSIGGVATRQSSYTYDVRGFLTSRRDTSIGTTSICEGTPDPNYGGVLCSGAFSKTFNSRDSVAYDSVGNVRYVDGPAASGAPLHTRNRLIRWPRITTSDTMRYDAAGQRLARNDRVNAVRNYFWTPDGLLEYVRTGPLAYSRMVQYEYNVFGELVRRSVSTSSGGSFTVDRHYLWDRGNLLADLDGTLTARKSEYAHFPGLDQPFAVLEGGTAITATRWVQTDLFGNVVGLTNTGGAIHTASLGTDAWGG